MKCVRSKGDVGYLKELVIHACKRNSATLKWLAGMERDAGTRKVFKDSSLGYGRAAKELGMTDDIVDWLVRNEKVATNALTVLFAETESAIRVVKGLGRKARRIAK